MSVQALLDRVVDFMLDFNERHPVLFIVVGIPLAVALLAALWLGAFYVPCAIDMWGVRSGVDNKVHVICGFVFWVLTGKDIFGAGPWVLIAMTAIVLALVFLGVWIEEKTNKSGN